MEYPNAIPKLRFVVEQIGSPLAGALQRLFVPPIVNGLLMAGKQNIGYGPATEFGRTRIDRRSQQTILEGIEERRGFVVEHPGYQPADRVDQHGCRPLERLRRMDLITPSLIGVHMTQLDDDEIALYAQSGAHVVHCPQSNLKLASGHCPVTRLREAGVNVALGTDGAASNNDLDMFAEMQTAALLAKGVGGDACSLPAEAVLQMATLDGARALGIDVLTGSLTVGKSADIVAIDLGAPETQPVYHPVSQIVYAAGREQVQHVWIQGRHLLNARRLSTIDLDDTLNRAAAWRDRIHAADERGGATDGR